MKLKLIIGTTLKRSKDYFKSLFNFILYEKGINFSNIKNNPRIKKYRFI